MNGNVMVMKIGVVWKKKLLDVASEAQAFWNVLVE